MSQNQEIIESKLCAFIDGELDADGRAEIEKHLEANPQHRRLLESLKATRDLIKWLPREAAPPEVAETLNGQLERSVLLDSESDTLGPGIGPRIFAAAAILLLTAGLGLAVYYTLPRSQKSATPYAFDHKDGAGMGFPDTAPADADRAPDELSTRRGAATVARAEQPEMMSKLAPAAKSGAAAAAGEAGTDDESFKRWVNDNRAAIAAVTNGAPAAAPANNAALSPVASNAVVMLVRSKAPEDANRRVTEFLVSQKIQWKETPAPESQPSQQTMVSRDLSQQQQAQSQVAQTPQAQQQQQQQIRQELSDAVAQSRVAGATTQSAGAAGQLAESTTQPAPGSYNFNKSDADKAQTTGRMYVARMSRQQAVTLGNTIAQEPAQSAELKDMAGSAVTFAELGAGRNSANSVTNNGTAYNNAAVTPSTTTPAQNHSFRSQMRGGGGGFGGGAGDGIGGRRAEGMAKSGTPATQPATEPAAPGAPAVAAEQGQLAVALPPVPGSQPATTQSVQGPATQGVEDAVDVVIVVESDANAEPAAATQPSSTQPAATQPTGER